MPEVAFKYPGWTGIFIVFVATPLVAGAIGVLGDLQRRITGPSCPPCPVPDPLPGALS